MLADVNLREGKTGEGTELLRRLAGEYPHTEFGRRAVNRLRAQR
jgi:hypothetical protein